MPGGGAGSPGVRDIVSAVLAGGLSAGVISRGGRGRGQEQPALPRPAGLGCPGDMMIDWVSPPAGMRPLSLIRPSAWPSGKGRQRLTADWRELAAVVPIG
jgi:hypothetical protein